MATTELLETLARIDPDPGSEFRSWGLGRIASTIAFLRRIIAPGSQALDVSSGPHFALLLAQGLPDVTWSHTDHDGITEVVFRDRMTQTPVFHYRPTAYAIGPDMAPPGGPWDVITCFEVVEHLDFNPGLFMARAADSLKQGGLLVLSTPNVGGLTPQFHAARGGRPHQTPFFPRAHWHHTREYGTYELRELVEWAGFEIVATETCNCYGSDISGYRMFVRQLCLILAGLLTIDPAAVRHAILHSGSTQFIAARRVASPRSDVPPPV